MNEPRAWGRIGAWGLAALCAAISGCTGNSGPEGVAREETETPRIEQLPSEGLSGEERAKAVASFEKVWTTIRDTHWDPALGGVDWDAVRAELLPKLEAAKDKEATRGVMREMLGRLKQSHFAIIPSDAYDARGGEADKAERTKPANDQETHQPAPAASDPVQPSSPTGGGAMPPNAPIAGTAAGPVGGGWASGSAVTKKGAGETGVRIRIVDDRALVTAVEAGSLAARAGVKPGWALVSVGNRQVERVIAALARSTHQIGQSALAALVLQGMLETDAGESVWAEFEDGSGERVPVAVPSGSARGNTTRVANLPEMHVRLEDRWLDGGIGYIALNIFADPARVMPAFGAAVEKFRDGKARGIIIDIRGNGGGIGGMSMGMGGWFVDQPNMRLGEMITRGGRLKFVLNPRPEPYLGPLAVLVDEGSMSTSEIFAGGLQDLGRARIFGTRTPGAALPSVIDVLPNGDRFQHAFANYISYKGEALEGKGVIPDEAAPPRREALLRGEDPALEAAVRWLMGRPEGSGR